jgi:hypothetical protein
MTSNRRARPVRVLLAIALAAPLLSPLHAQFPGGGVQPARAVVKQFDRDGNGRLNAAERQAAREFLATQPSGGFGRGGRGAFATPAAPSPVFNPDTARSSASVPSTTWRAPYSLQFENIDWDEGSWLNNTDVKCRHMGSMTHIVCRRRTRASSFGTVPRSKLSLNVTVDLCTAIRFRSSDAQSPECQRRSDVSAGVLYLQAAREVLRRRRWRSRRPQRRASRICVNVSGRRPSRRWYPVEAGADGRSPAVGRRGGLECRRRRACRRVFDIRTEGRPRRAALIN